MIYVKEKQTKIYNINTSQYNIERDVESVTLQYRYLLLLKDQNAKKTQNSAQTQEGG